MQPNKDTQYVYLPLSRKLATSLLLLALVAEWVLPLRRFAEWTELYVVESIVLVVGLALVAGVITASWWGQLLINAAVIWFTIMFLFNRGGLDAWQWVLHIGDTLRHDLLGIAVFNDWALSGELRTAILFTGAAMLVLALQSLLWMRQWGVGLAALTLFYLLVLHWVAGVAVFGALLRTAFYGLLLAGLLTIPRLERVYGMSIYPSGKGGWPMRWLAATCALAGFFVLGSYLVSAQKPALQQPLAWEQINWNSMLETLGQLNNGGQAAVQGGVVPPPGIGSALSTGYGFDDRVLGAPVASDDTIALTVQSPVRSYWRGETKDTYDGRGWSQSLADQASLAVGSGAGEQAGGRYVDQVVIVHDPDRRLPLFAMGGSNTIVALQLEGGAAAGTYRAGRLSDSLYVEEGQAAATSYTVRTWLPDGADGADAAGVAGEAVPGLIELSNALQLAEQAELPDRSELYSIYTALPEELPERVGALAAQIAAEAGDDPYSQAQAIAAYLREHYTYSMSNTSVPPRGVDFVDHFLFEQKQGYCVHFSTAMVVMVRTLGIPARWVKGFAPGQAAVGSGAGGVESGGTQVSYTVRTSDAHAWAEVYVEGIGWVAMEPTPAAGVPGFGANGDASAVAGTGEEVRASGGDGWFRGAWEATSGWLRTAYGNVEGQGAAFAASMQHQADQLGAWLATSLSRIGNAELLPGSAGTGHGGADGKAGQGAAAWSIWVVAVVTVALLLALVSSHPRIRLRMLAVLYRWLLAKRKQAFAARLAERMAGLAWRRLYGRYGARKAAQTLREYAATLPLEAGSGPATALQQLLRWDEEARYNRVSPQLPSSARLAAAVKAFL